MIVLMIVLYMYVEIAKFTCKFSFYLWLGTHSFATCSETTFKASKFHKLTVYLQFQE